MTADEEVSASSSAGEATAASAESSADAAGESTAESGLEDDGCR